MSLVQFGIIGLNPTSQAYSNSLKIMKHNRHPLDHCFYYYVMFSLICFDTHLYGIQTLTMFIYMSSYIIQTGKHLITKFIVVAF